VKLLILLLLLASGAVLAVASLVFRSARATRLLRQLRLVAWVYVAVVVLAAAYRIWQQGGL
jgi:chromate transport protein ChrA